jgi:hypothetical protein
VQAGRTASGAGDTAVVAGLILPLTGPQAALNVELRTLTQVTDPILAQTLGEDNDAMPLGLLAAIAALARALLSDVARFKMTMAPFEVLRLFGSRPRLLMSCSLLRLAFRFSRRPCLTAASRRTGQGRGTRAH